MIEALAKWLFTRDGYLLEYWDHAPNSTRLKYRREAEDCIDVLPKRPIDYVCVTCRDATLCENETVEIEDPSLDQRMGAIRIAANACRDFVRAGYDHHHVASINKAMLELDVIEKLAR